MHNKQTKRNRRLHVCDACRVRKLKCDKTKPICSRCAKHGLQCIYNPYRQKDEPETIETLKKELSDLRAKLLIGSPASCTSEVSRPKLSWENFVTPVKVGGVWRSYYSPFSDLALFARDPFLRGLDADLFEQETAFHETQINLKLQDLTDTDPRMIIKRLLPNKEVLIESKTMFYTQIHHHYSFFQRDHFESLFEEVILKSHLDTKHAPFVLMTALLMLCLTNFLSIPAETILHWADQLKIVASPNEDNLSCLLYLKVYSDDMKLRDKFHDALSSSIRNMALNLGLFAIKSPDGQADITRNMWMGAVALLEPLSFDHFFIEKFEFSESDHTNTLWYEYMFHLKLSQVWECVLTSSPQLEPAIAQLRSYHECELSNNTDEFFKSSCELSLVTLELNISWMFYMQNELHNFPADESLLTLLKDKFMSMHAFLTKDYCVLNKGGMRLKALGFALKTFVAYATGMSLRRQKKDMYSAHGIFYEDLNFCEMASEVFLRWSNDIPWQQRLLRLWDIHDSNLLLKNLQQEFAPESRPSFLVANASKCTGEFLFEQLESPKLGAKISPVSSSSSASVSGSSSAFYEASDLISFENVASSVFAADNICFEVDSLPCPASQDFTLDVNTQ
ncbi:LAQU0S02e00276g1_1 [Lachancea quebecensis]|uniref:LAQU0S02e00276g1_1 n=1 Tax=Lachancea quebecensis TaxID=1654605 RepID=A0A0P1KLQ0_9SACH|nr:LAQU0S02e00276g1_1 [Lachancea quebecensis]